MAADRPLVLSIVGTRPEAIKLAPVLRALAARPRLAQGAILTGQHSGLAPMLPSLPADRLIELSVDLSEQSAGEVRDTLRHVLGLHFLRLRPAMVLVQGDTTSALAGAFAAKDVGVPVGHVEAGLRSGDLQQPWPEEGNRIAIDEVADLLFAPSLLAMANLEAERAVRGDALLTGNTGIDALLDARAALPPPPPARDGRRTILVTCHRRENRGPAVAALARALRRLTDALPVEIAFLLHPNHHLRSAMADRLAGIPHVSLLEPLAYADMVALIDRCWLILTDSGGLQEEGPALGRPVLVLREVTERAEGTACGNAVLVGMDPDRIVAAVTALHRDPALYARMATPALPFGDGRAAPRIADRIEAFLHPPAPGPAMAAAAGSTAPVPPLAG